MKGVVIKGLGISIYTCLHMVILCKVRRLHFSAELKHLKEWKKQCCAHLSELNDTGIFEEMQMDMFQTFVYMDCV